MYILCIVLSMSLASVNSNPVSSDCPVVRVSLEDFNRNGAGIFDEFWKTGVILESGYILRLNTTPDGCSLITSVDEEKILLKRIDAAKQWYEVITGGSNVTIGISCIVVGATHSGHVEIAPPKCSPSSPSAVDSSKDSSRTVWIVVVAATMAVAVVGLACVIGLWLTTCCFRSDAKKPKKAAIQQNIGNGGETAVHIPRVDQYNSASHANWVNGRRFEHENELTR